MRGKTTIKKDGTIIVEVLDREGSDCRQAVKLVVGELFDEEETGPYCDTVIETSSDDAA